MSGRILPDACTCARRHLDCSPPTPEDDLPQYLTRRPQDIRAASRLHRYAHYIRTVPPRLEALAGELELPPAPRVLDYGCADVPYRHFFAADADFVPADLPGNPDAALELNPDSTVPAPDASFDAVLSTQVLEHVDDPRLYLAECARVLRPDGRLLLSTHGVFCYHPDPGDYWRWTCAGLRRVVEEAGLEVVHLEGIIGLGAAGLQLTQDAFYFHLPRRVQPVFAFLMQSLIALVERLPRQRPRELDASVFAVVARKPP